jgi:cell division protein ZapA
MSTVTLTIGPKSYSVACADGQEAHITQLGAMIAEKYAQLGASRAPLEAQNLLFAALFLADELAEARKAAVLAPPEAAPPPVDTPPVDTEAMDALRNAITVLEADLAAARADAAAPAPAATPQIDLFGGSQSPDMDLAEIASRLEALANRTEASATALEAAVASA